jgi:hypothetical protein
MFSWTRSIGGKFINSQFANADRALCRYPEYRGYTVVFSGRTSLHFHFVFRTQHLKAAPWDADAADRRRTCEEVSALMHNVHDRYWDCTLEHFIKELRPSFAPDQKMRSATQWRRMGGGVRVIDKDTPLLGLEIGARVPQLIMHENIRERAPRSAEGFLVSPNITLSTPPIRRRRRASAHPLPCPGVTEDAIMLLQDLCSCEWGMEYPKPVSVGQQNGELVIQFQNHAGDRKPSTVCVGPNRRLLLAGRHELQGDFHLPDNMTADEFVRHVQCRCGVLSSRAEPISLPGDVP